MRQVCSPQTHMESWGRIVASLRPGWAIEVHPKGKKRNGGSLVSSAGAVQQLPKWWCHLLEAGFLIPDIRGDNDIWQQQPTFQLAVSTSFIWFRSLTLSHIVAHRRDECFKTLWRRQIDRADHSCPWCENQLPEQQWPIVRIEPFKLGPMVSQQTIS